MTSCTALAETSERTLGIAGADPAGSGRGLTGAAGVAFLTVWAYLTLSIAVGQASASFLIGLGLTVLAAVFWSLARNRFTKKTASDPPVSQPVAPAIGETDLASQIAFTAAFVLARNLGKGRQD
jgi:hypothetical protein